MHNNDFRKCIIEGLNCSNAEELYDNSVLPKLLAEDPEFIYHYDIDHWINYLKAGKVQFLTDEQLASTISELEHELFTVLEEYCHMKDEGFIVYSGMANWVRTLIDYSYERGRRNHE